MGRERFWMSTRTWLGRGEHERLGQPDRRGPAGAGASHAGVARRAPPHGLPPTVRDGQVGSVLTIRDGSAPGVNLRTTLRGSVALTDPATEPTPDLILVCVGRAETEESVAASLDALVATAATYSPTPAVVLVAAPTAPTSVLETVRVRSLQWADERGIPVIDVRADAEGRGADLLTSDPVEIGDPGATFWGRAIRDRLGS